MGSQIRVFRIFKAHIWVKYHTLQGTGCRENSQKCYFKQIGHTFESEAKFSRYNFIEIHRVLAAREYGNITNGSRYEPRSNANHGTNDLNLPIDSRVFEAAIQGVDLHAIRFAQHLPETQIGFAQNTKAIRFTQNLP